MSAVQTETNYRIHITLPIFGMVPLHPADIIADLRKKEDAPLWAQIFKYGVCGVLSMVVFAAVVLAFEVLFPSFLSDKHSIEVRQFNTTIAYTSAFIVSNFFAFFTNRIFVFTPGKHSFLKEITIFTIISAISFVAGHFGKTYAIDAGFSNLVAALSFAISSALINFIARKFIVFEK